MVASSDQGDGQSNDTQIRHDPIQEQPDAFISIESILSWIRQWLSMQVV
jgi:hypothetical protein